MHLTQSLETQMSTVGHERTPPITAYAHLAKIPGVRGGNAIVAGTRIGVHDVVGLLNSGETIDSLISRCFPELKRSQVYECLAYYEDHRGEIDLLIAKQQADEDH